MERMETNNNRIVIWGTGHYASELLCALEEMSFYRDEIVSFCDNDPSKWNTRFYEYEIISPNELHKKDFDFLVIATMHENEIRNQLKNENSQLLEKTMNWIMYRCRANAANKYWKRCGKALPASSDSVETKAVVYTAVIGNYDTLYDPEYIDPNIVH